MLKGIFLKYGNIVRVMKSSRSHRYGISGLTGIGITLFLVVLICGCTQQAVPIPGTPTTAATQTIAGMPNPASVACAGAGGTVEIEKDTAGNEYGMCSFKNGTSCEEWALFRNEGCQPGITATPASEGKKMVTFTEADNGTTGDITQSTRFAVVLAENPTTGYTWNASLSPGLELQSTDYHQDDAPSGMVGVGGTRTWVIIAKDLGDQKFSAVYGRSWEPVSGNETLYSVTIRVVKA
jgi:inhibitor of cysteine peptidase